MNIDFSMNTHIYASPVIRSFPVEFLKYDYLNVEKVLSAVSVNTSTVKITNV